MWQNIILRKISVYVLKHNSVAGRKSKMNTTKAEYLHAHDKLKQTNSVTCELLIVGSGPSGLSAAVQAAELGLKTVLIEVNNFLGGNGPHTEGVFAVDSKFQKEQNIKITLREIIESECVTFNYHINSLCWKDLIENSAENIDWLISHGVGFSGIVDECKGVASIKPFHWFERRSSDGRGNGYLLVEPLAEAARQLGVDIYNNTRGTELIMNEGKVTGLYAINTETGNVLRFSCSAVILATGGFVDNAEMMRERGFDEERLFRRGFGGHNGDGLRMAVSAGAEDISRLSTYLHKIYTYPLSAYSQSSACINLKGRTLWVNGDGERFANEFCGEVVPGFYTNAKMTQPSSYTVFDSAFIEKFKEEAPDLLADLETLLDSEYNNCFRADTIRELALLAAMDPDVFEKNVERYNEMCDNRYDDDFAKDPSKLIHIRTAPFYMVRQDIAVWTSFGAVKTNRKFEALTPTGAPVPGLYCVGVDGCRLYWDCYTLTVPGSANGNNVNSGRTAAKAAFDYIRK